MKKLLIIAIVLVVLATVAIAIPMSIRYDYIQYEKEMTAHIAAVSAGGSATAKNGDVYTRISVQNLSRINWAVTISDKSRKFSPPEYDEEDTITIRFSDGAELNVFLADEAEDIVLVYYSFDGKNRCYSITGYKVHKWVAMAVSPGGYTVKNEIITEEEML